MTPDASLLDYYAARAPEYEKVYAKPERQEDLRALHALVPDFFDGRHVLEVACGTGYWTRRLTTRAAHVTGVDLGAEVLAIAAAVLPAGAPVELTLGDAYALERIPGEFDAAFAGFWVSHIERSNVSRFLGGLHRRLHAGSWVMLVDNRYVEGSSWPITRTDESGNTYQLRQLDDGTWYEVLKNFPPPSALRASIESAGGRAVEVRELVYYWYATYRVGALG